MSGHKKKPLFGICNFAREIVLGKEKPNYWLEASQIIYHIERLSKALLCDNDGHETDDDDNDDVDSHGK